MTKGLKYDTGKATFWRALRRFPKALAGAARAADYGFEKYCRNTGLPDDNWKSVPEAEKRYLDALMRHWLAMQEGETHDAESGLSHWDHFAWNALALSQMGHEASAEVAPGVIEAVQAKTEEDLGDLSVFAPNDPTEVRAKIDTYMTQRRSEQEASPPKPMTTKA